MGRLFPRETALLELLKLINDPELADLWAERRNPSAGSTSTSTLRKNGGRCAVSRLPPATVGELAVRNQFFTPRYVV